MDRSPGPSRVICLTRQPGIGQSLFMLRSMGSDASSCKPQPRLAQSTQRAGEPDGRVKPGHDTVERAAPLLRRHGQIPRRIVVEDWPQPALPLADAHALAGGVVLSLVALDLGDPKIV